MIMKIYEPYPTGFTNCALSLGLPPICSYFLIEIHLDGILSFGDCEVECPLDKRLETEVCGVHPLSNERTELFTP